MKELNRIRSQLNVLLRMTDKASGYGAVRDLAGVVGDVVECIEKLERRIKRSERKSDSKSRVLERMG